MVKTTEFNVQTQMNYVVGNMSGFTAAYTGMDNLSALLSSLMTSYTTMAGTGRAAYASLGAAISAVGLKSAEAFGEYQRGMNMVKAISNNTNAQMQMLSQSAQQFSSQFRMGIQDINDGLVTLGRAGLTDVNNQIEVLKNGLQVAKISGMDLASTLEDIVTTTSLLGGDIKSNTFGAETKEVSNLLVATSLSGPLNVSDVIETLKFAGGSAAAAGATLNNEEGLHDLLGTIGAFSQKGVTGSIAGTALRAFITKPASQDQKVSDALEKLGLDAYSLWEKDPEQGWHMKPIAEQIGMITKAMNDNHLTNLDRIEVWGDIVGNKMGQQMLKLDENRIKETTKDIEHQRNLEDIYQGTLTNFASQVERLNQIFQAIYRNIGSGFASMLTGVVQGFADVLEFLNSIGNGVLFKVIAPILGPLGLYGLAKGLKDFVELLGMLKANIQSSLERPIKGQPLYQPYEDWETSRRGGGYGGTVRSSGTVNITGPTTVQSTGNIQSSKDFLKELSLKYNPPVVEDPRWREIERRTQANRAKWDSSLNIPGNALSKGSIYDIYIKDPNAFTDRELANLQKYEGFARSMRYLGANLAESGQLLDSQTTGFTKSAIDVFAKALNLDDNGKRLLKHFAGKMPDYMKKWYDDIEVRDKQDPTKFSAQYTAKMTQLLTKRIVNEIFKADYGSNANFYKFLTRDNNGNLRNGVDLSLFNEYLNIPVEKFKARVKSGELEKGTPEYIAAQNQVAHQVASMRKLGAFNFLGTIDQNIEGTLNSNESVMELALANVQRAIEGFTFNGEIQNKVNDELMATKNSISALKDDFKNEGSALGQALAVKGYIQEGMGIHSPGYMYYSTAAELARINTILRQFKSQYGVDGKILGSAIIEGLGFELSNGYNAIQAQQEYAIKDLVPRRSDKFIAFDMETTGTVYNHTDLDRNDSILTMGAALFENGVLNEDYIFNTEDRGIIRYKTNGRENPIKPEAAKANKLAYDSNRFNDFLYEEDELREFQKFVERVLGTTIDQAIKAKETINLVAHNGNFDLTMLENTIQRVNMALKATGASDKELIPDIHKVLSLVDTMDVGRQAIRDKYGIDIARGVGPEGMMSLGIKYQSPFNENEEIFMGDYKLDSFGKITGVQEEETHNALQDAIDAGRVYTKLEGGELPDGQIMFGTTLMNDNLRNHFVSNYANHWIDQWLNQEKGLGVLSLASLAPFFQGFDFDNINRYGIYERATGAALLEALTAMGLNPEYLAGGLPFMYPGFEDLGILSERDLAYKNARVTNWFSTRRNGLSRTSGARSSQYSVSNFPMRFPQRNGGDNYVDYYEGESIQAYDDQRLRITIHNPYEDIRQPYLDKRQMEYNSLSSEIKPLVTKMISDMKNGTLSASDVSRLFDSGIFDYLPSLGLSNIYMAYAKDGRRGVGAINTFSDEDYDQTPKAVSPEKGFDLFFDTEGMNSELKNALSQWLQKVKDALLQSVPYEKPIKFGPREAHQALLNMLATDDEDIKLLQLLGANYQSRGYDVYKHGNSNFVRYNEPDIDSIVDGLIQESDEGAYLTKKGRKFFADYGLSHADRPRRDIVESKVRELLQFEKGWNIERLASEYIPDHIRLVQDEDNSRVGDRLTTYDDYTDEARHVIYSKEDEKLQAALMGKVPRIHNLLDIISLANQFGHMWSLENNQLVFGGYDNEQWRYSDDIEEVEAELLEMEEIFKRNTNNTGAYFNFNNLKNPLDSFHIIDDLPRYRRLKDSYEARTGEKWVGGEDYIPHEEALQNLIDLGELGVQELMQRAPIGFRPDILPRVRRKALSFVQNQALAYDPRPSNILPQQFTDSPESRLAHFKTQFKLLDDKKGTKEFLNNIKQVANDLGLSLENMVIKIGEETIPFGTALQKYGREGIVKFLDGLQMKSPPKAFTEFLSYVYMLPNYIKEATISFGMAAYALGNSFVQGFRDGAGFHSPIEVIEEFKRQLGEDFNFTKAIGSNKRAEFEKAARIMMDGLVEGLEKGELEITNVLDELDKLFAQYKVKWSVDEGMKKGNVPLANSLVKFSNDIYKKYKPELETEQEQVSEKPSVAKKAKSEQPYPAMTYYALNGQEFIDSLETKLFNIKTLSSMPSDYYNYSFSTLLDLAEQQFRTQQLDQWQGRVKNFIDKSKTFVAIDDFPQLLASLPGIGDHASQRLMSILRFKDSRGATLSSLASAWVGSDLHNPNAPFNKQLVKALIKNQIQNVLPLGMSNELFGTNMENLSEKSFKKFLNMSPNVLSKKFDISSSLAQLIFDSFSFERRKNEQGQYYWERNLHYESPMEKYFNKNKIPGIGEKTIAKLEKHFGTIDNVFAAQYSEIEEAIGKKAFAALKPMLEERRINRLNSAVNKLKPQQTSYYDVIDPFKSSIAKAFEDVSGVGEKSILKLEARFKDLDGLFNASYQDIKDTIGNKGIESKIWAAIPQIRSKSNYYVYKDSFSSADAFLKEREQRLKEERKNTVVKNLDKATPINADPNEALRKKLYGDIFEQPVHQPKIKGTTRAIKTPISDPARDLRMKIFGDVFKNAGKNITKSKISPEQKIQQRNQRAIEKWTQELIKGSMTQEQYGALLDGLTLSGQNFEAELQEANANLLKFSNELLTGTFEDEAARDELRGKIQQEIATIETLNEAKRRETTASISAAEADKQESVAGRLSGFAGAVGGMAGKLANGMFGLMMNPYVMLVQMVWGYVQQGIEMIKQQEEEKISKLSEIASNAESSYDEQTSKWEEAQSKANEKFGDLSDNEKQDQMLEAIQKAREDNNSASAETKALLGKQNALISSSDNMINTKMNQGLTGYNGIQANWEEFMQGSGMVGSKDEFGLMDYLNPDNFKNDSNTARIQAMADATIQIDTRVKNMEEMTEDYQKVMASFGVAGRSMLDIYNVRGILSDNFFSGTFFDPNSSQRIGAPGFRSAEQLAMLMKKEEKILQRFENRYLRFTRSTTGQGDRITVTLGEGSIHDLANQLGVKDVEAAQMLAVHELQRIQDVMLNQVEPELAQTAISMYQGAYTLEQNKNLNDVQAAFQNTMTQGIFAIQAQVAQLVYKATMEQALSDYQAATGDTETDTIGLLLNRARDTSYEYHDQAKQFASQGWGGFMQARDLNHLVNQGYTQEEAMNKLLEQGKDGDYYKKLYGEQLGKFEYNGDDPLRDAIITAPFKEIRDLAPLFNYNDYEGFSKYTDWMMKSYAGEVPLDQAIKTLNDAQTAADSEGDNGKDTDDSDANKQRYVQLAICNKKAIPKLNVNLFKKAPTFTVLNKNFKLRDIKINTADKAKNIENSLKNAIIDVQERSDPKIIQDSEAEYDPVGATDDATNLPTGASLTK